MQLCMYTEKGESKVATDLVLLITRNQRMNKHASDCIASDGFVAVSAPCVLSLRPIPWHNYRVGNVVSF